MTANLIGDIKISPAITITAGAAGSSAVNGSIIDMTGYRSVLVVVQFGAIVSGAVTSIKMQQDTVVGFGGAADLAGTGQTIADTDDDKIFYIDLVAPLEQFVRLVVSRATQNATCAATYYQYRGRSKPAVQPSGVAGEVWIAPAEGAA